jgi:hypothetical protein
VEKVGGDGGGQLGGEIGERGPAVRHGVDPGVARALAEPGCGDRLAGQSAGEQPCRVGRRSDAGVGAAGADELGQDDSKRLGRGHVMLAEPDEDAAVMAGDLAGGDGGDTRQLLAVEQEQAASGPVGEVEGVVVQQPGHLCPPLVLGGSGAVVAGGGRDVQVRAVAAGCGPEQEVSRLAGSRPGAQLVVAQPCCRALPARPGDQAGHDARALTGFANCTWPYLDTAPVRGR